METKPSTASTWTDAILPWSTQQPLAVLKGDAERDGFWALHPADGLFFSTDGYKWSQISRGMPPGLVYFDVAVFHASTMTGPERYFLATSAGVYRSEGVGATLRFRKSSQGLPAAHVSSIAWNGVWSDGHGEMICGISFNGVGRRPLYMSGDIGGNWFDLSKGYPDVGSGGSDAVEILLRNGYHIRSRREGLFYSHDTYSWSRVSDVGAVTSLGSSGALTFAANTVGELWRYEPSFPYPAEVPVWLKVPSPGYVTALGKTYAATPLVANIRGKGIWLLHGWGSPAPDWDDTFTAGFPGHAGRPFDAYLVSITKSANILCAGVHDLSTNSYRVLACRMGKETKRDVVD